MSILFPTHGNRRAAFIPLLIGAGLTTGVDTRAAGLGTSINFYYKLSQALHDDMERIADSLSALQTQITSLARILELRDQIQSRRQDSHLWGPDPRLWMARVSVGQLFLRPYSPLPTSDYPYDDAQPSAGSSQNRVEAPHTII
ncbi:unnamed protein product [Nyctereutes procyonoides]|uniref:(raccoon dog) hypothetical protein n=1 Tax=Nyctereutes procyonoides TaxID=34880 RepID=A0A811ZH74_NYCPR|nr:unnamed protein product [Nyctereutes procyonoides]